MQNLRDRRVRGDLIQQYKIMHSFDKVNWYREQNFMPSINSGGPATAIRGHGLRLRPEKKHLGLRDNFFTNRVCDTWNKLDTNCVYAKSINQFKNLVDKSAYAQEGLWETLIADDGRKWLLLILLKFRKMKFDLLHYFFISFFIKYVFILKIKIVLILFIYSLW